MGLQHFSVSDNKRKHLEVAPAAGPLLCGCVCGVLNFGLVAGLVLRVTIRLQLQNVPKWERRFMGIEDGQGAFC